jgi:protein phosphatase PTC7
MFASDNILVVADGVGGWADQGIDPGLYSKKLCEIISKKVKSSLNNYVDDPQKLVV